MTTEPETQIAEIPNITDPVNDETLPPDVSVEVPETEESKVEEKVVVVKEEPVQKDAAEEAAEALKHHIDENKKLQEELARERAAKVQAEQSVKKAEDSSRDNLVKANETAANRDKDAERVKMEAARKEAIAFQEAGEFEKAEEARERAVESRIKIGQIDNYLKQLEEYKKQPVVENTLKPDPVTGSTFTEKTQAWINEHMEQWKDPEFRADAAGADAAARARGLQPDTDAYFAFCNKRLGLDKTIEPPAKEPVVEKPVVEPPKQQSSRPASAAPSRNVPNTVGAGKKTIKLTGEQRAVAQDIINSAPELFKGMSPDQVYAQEISKLQQERGEKWWESQ